MVDRTVGEPVPVIVMLNKKRGIRLSKYLQAKTHLKNGSYYNLEYPVRHYLYSIQSYLLIYY